MWPFLLSCTKCFDVEYICCSESSTLLKFCPPYSGLACQTIPGTALLVLLTHGSGTQWDIVPILISPTQVSALKVADGRSVSLYIHIHMYRMRSSCLLFLHKSCRVSFQWPFVVGQFSPLVLVLMFCLPESVEALCWVWYHRYSILRKRVVQSIYAGIQCCLCRDRVCINGLHGYVVQTGMLVGL